MYENDFRLSISKNIYQVITVKKDTASKAALNKRIKFKKDKKVD